MKKVKILLACLLLATSSWAATIYPTADILYRPKYSTDHWIWNDNSYPKLSTTEGATAFECKWSSKMFAIQQYEIPDFAKVKTLKITLTANGNTGDLAVWDFAYEFPVATNDDGTKRQEFISHVELSTGVDLNTTTGSFTNALSTAKHTNGTWTFTIDASKLTPIAYKEDGTTAIVNILITSATPSQGTAGKYASNNSANDEAKRPFLVVEEMLNELTLPVNEYCYRFGADGEKWKFVKKISSSTDAEFELNFYASFCAIEQFYIKDFDKSKLYSLKIAIKSARSAQAYNFPEYKHDTISATYLKGKVEEIVGVTMGASSGTANAPISTCSRNESSDLTLTIPGTKLNVLYTDARGYAVVNLLLTNIETQLFTDNSLKIYTSNVNNEDAKKPSWTFAGYANVYNETQDLTYDDLNTACGAANANDIIRVNNDLSANDRINVTTNPVTIYGRTPQTKIKFTQRGKLMFLTKTYSSNDRTYIKNLTLVNDNNSPRDVHGIEVNKPTVLENVTFVSEAGYNDGKCDVYASQQNVTLVGNNVMPGGISLANDRRIDDGIDGPSPRTTHTTPIAVTLANIGEGKMVVAHGWGARKDMYQLTNEGYALYVNADNGDLKAFAVQPISLSETEDNEELIAKYKGVATDITLSRTIAGSATDYSTICLPFETTIDELGAAEVYVYSNATFDGDDVATLYFVPATDLEAGKPYLVRFAENKENPVFEDKTITAATPGKYGDSNYEFAGLFSQTKITETEDKSLMYLGSSNTLYWAGENCTIKGSRGYFKAVSAPAKTARRVAIGHQAPTNIETRDAQCTMHDGKFLINGQFVIVKDNKKFNAQGQIFK